MFSAAFSSTQQKNEVLFKEYNISNELSEEHKRVPSTKMYFKLTNSFQYSNSILSNDSISIYVQDIGGINVYRRLDMDMTKEKIENANLKSEQVPNSRKKIEYHKVNFGKFHGVLTVYQSNSDQPFSCEFIVTNNYHGFHFISNSTKDFRNIAKVKTTLLSFIYNQDADISDDYMRFVYDFSELDIIHLTQGNKNQFTFTSDTTGGKEANYHMSISQTKSFEKGALDNLESIAINISKNAHYAIGQKITDQGKLDINGLNGYFIESTVKSDLEKNYRYFVVMTDSQYLFVIDGISLTSSKNNSKKLLEAIHSIKSKN
jgi:hypothetical protein